LGYFYQLQESLSLSSSNILEAMHVKPGQEGEIAESTNRVKRVASEFDVAVQPVKKLKPAKS
jgi:hypothetical protein